MHCSVAPTSPHMQGSQYPNPQWISTCHWIILFAHPQCSHTWHTCRESFNYTQSHWLRTSWNKLFMGMHAFFKCCVTLAHTHGTPAKLTVWILSPPLAAAFGQIIPMPSTIAHTSHNCGIPCNHIILCMDMLWNTLQALSYQPMFGKHFIVEAIMYIHIWLTATFYNLQEKYMHVRSNSHQTWQ
jgi:hypothetical protein